eukprot:353273-Chlamydomonas_euryale.AAC.14
MVAVLAGDITDTHRSSLHAQPSRMKQKTHREWATFFTDPGKGRAGMHKQHLSGSAGAPRRVWNQASYCMAAGGDAGAAAAGRRSRLPPPENANSTAHRLYYRSHHHQHSSPITTTFTSSPLLTPQTLLKPPPPPPLPPPPPQLVMITQWITV